jgi:hypothetical protein
MFAAAAGIFRCAMRAQPVKRAVTVATGCPERRKVIFALEPSSSGQL